MSQREDLVRIALGEVGKSYASHRDFGLVMGFLGYNEGVDWSSTPPARTPVKEANMHSESITSRFWSYVDVSAPDACWEWKRARVHDGYGRFKAANQQWRAHRFAWTITNGPIPDGLAVMHKCDNRACCNPAHLALGTISDNNWDKIKKGRFQDQTGERNPSNKLTADDVKDIRTSLVVGLPYSEIAERYGVDPGTIGAIARGETWSHVPADEPVGPRGARGKPGDSNPQAKLTTEQVIAIRQAAASGEYRKSIAERFGLNKTTVDRIVWRQSWRHVP